MGARAAADENWKTFWVQLSCKCPLYPGRARSKIFKNGGREGRV